MPAAAQTGQIFGEIVGKVADDVGGVLPGVTVSLSGPAIMGVRTAVTNEVGTVSLPGVNPGSYQMKFELSGFATLIREYVIVAARSTVTIDVGMKMAGVQETITVTGASPTVDVENTKVAARFDAATARSGAHGEADLQHGDAGAGGGQFRAGSGRHQRDVEELHDRARRPTRSR